MLCFYQALVFTFFPNLTREQQSFIMHRYELQHGYWRIFNVLIAIFLIVANLTVIFGILKTRRLQHIHLPQKLFLMSSAVSMVAGIVLLYQTMTDLMLKGSCLLESIGDTILTLCLLLDFEFLLTMCIVRFISIKAPLRRIKPKTVYVILVNEVLLALLACAFNYAAFFYIPSPVELFQIYWIALGISLLICVSVGVLLIILLINILRSQKSKFKDQKTQTDSHHKAVNRLAAIQTIYVVMNLTLVIVSIYFGWIIMEPSNLEPISFSRDAIIMTWAFPLSTCYCGFNALTYIYHSKNIQRYYFKKFITRNDDNSTNEVKSSYSITEM